MITLQVTVAVVPVPVDFTFWNTSWTYDGTIKTAEVTPNPWYAQYDRSLVSTSANVGEYPISATGKSPYTGTKSGTLTISAAAVSFAFSNLTYTYDGSQKTATVTPTPSNATYTADLTRGPEPGSYTVTAQGTGNFTGSASATMVINSPYVVPPTPQPQTPGITPPSGAATLVGTLSGSVSVDNKGSASYSIPLQIPPGRSGLQPSISLNYSSGGGNGPLGVGFSLSTGFPQSITRGRSILARDGETRGVTFTSTDKFYLDGKRLICVSTDKSYGQPGSAYRTEVDSFVTITTEGTGTTSADWNIDTFTVTDKSGTKMTFGKYGTSSPDAYQVGFVRIIQGWTGVEERKDDIAYTWAIKRIEDTLHNAVNFFYNDYGDGEYQLSQISYTEGTGVSAQAAVNFIYDKYLVPGNDGGGAARKDITTRYEALRRFQTKRRLDRIEGQMIIAGTPTVVSAYDLLYKYSAADNVTSLLESIRPQFLDPTESTLLSVPATKLEWNETPPSYTSIETPANAVPRGYVENTFGFGDVNGDGKDDFIDWCGSTINVSLSNGTGFDAPAPWLTLPSTLPPSIPLEEIDYAEVKICDINGDGLKDLILMPHDVNYHLRVRNIYAVVSNGKDKFVPLSGSGDDPTFVYTITTEFSDPVGGYNSFAALEQRSVLSRISVADFTGDGRDDILIHRYDGWLQLFNNLGGSFLKMPLVDVGADVLQAQPMIELWSHRFLGFDITNNFSVSMMPCDLNGDGITDYAWTETHLDLNSWSTGSTSGTAFGSVTKVWAVTCLPGGGFSEKAMVYEGGFVGGTSNGRTPYRQPNFTIMPGDVNGDGRSDFTVVVPGDQVDASVYGTLGASGVAQQRILRRQIMLSEGSSGTPRFKTLGTESGPEPRVSLNETTMVLPSWDWIPAGEWVGGFENVATLPNVQVKGLLLSACRNPSGGNVTMCDVNHDGRQDYVWYVNSNWWVTYSLGESFGAPQLAPLNWTPTAPMEYGPSTASISTRMPLDLNGDGIQDYSYDVGDSTAGPGISGFHISSGQPGVRLKSITNGLKQTTSIAYKPLTDDTIYTKGAKVSYPIRELRNATYVVSDVWHDAGVDGQTARFTYQYSGNRLDLSGRGSLGFHSFVTFDEQTKLFKYQFLAQSFPMTGLTAREETYRYLGANTFNIISSHDNTVVFDKVVNGTTDFGTVWPFISQAVEYRWEDSETSFKQFTPPTTGNTVTSNPEGLFGISDRTGAHIVITAKSWFDEQPPNNEPQTTIPGGYYASDFNVGNPAATRNVVSSVSGGSVASPAFKSLLNAFTSGTYGRISNGNLKQLKTIYDANYSETVQTEYEAGVDIPNTVFKTLTGRPNKVTTTVTSPLTDALSETAPIKTYTYMPGTPLVLTETVDAGATGVTHKDATLSTTTTYDRDTLGRVKSTTISSPDPAIDTYIVSEVPDFTTDFDNRFDLPKKIRNNHGHTTTTVYHDFLGKPTSVLDVNGAGVTTMYDALGRTIQQTDVLKNLTTNTSFALDTTVTVAPPETAAGSGTYFNGVAPLAPVTGVVGVALKSAYKITTTATVAPTTTAYYDRLGRVIRTIKSGFNGQQIVADTAYNNLGQQIATSLPYKSADYTTAPFWTKTSYDALGRVKEVLAPNLTKTTNTYAGSTTTVTVTPDGGTAQSNATLVDPKGRTIKVWNANPTDGTLSGTVSLEFKLDGFGRMRETWLEGLSDDTHKIAATYDALGHQLTLNDPDKGLWKYTNNALGQVVRQEDANHSVTTSTFDRLGRPLKRTTKEIGTGTIANPNGPVESANFYYYDSGNLENKPNTVDVGTRTASQPNAGWIGAPEREEADTTGAPGFDAPKTVNLHYYNSVGLPSLNLSQTDGKWFYTYSDYDQYSRPQQVRHYWKTAGTGVATTQPYLWQDFGYSYTYDGPSGGNDPLSKSYLIKLTDSLGRSWWDSPVYDHMDRVTGVKKGNSLVTTRSYDPKDGTLTAIATGSIQNMTFGFDGLGNLINRSDGTNTEAFGYDNLNRLEKRGPSAGALADYASYNLNGNITAKINTITSGYSTLGGSFSYDSTQPGDAAGKPHAVRSAWGFNMKYDDNGNLIERSGNGETSVVKWAGFDKPRWMARDKTGSDFTTDTVGSEFIYNAARSRVMQLEFDQMATGNPSRYVRKRIYAMGSTLELNYTTAAPALSPTWDLDTVRIYVPGPDGIIGAREFRPALATPEKALVYHYDHLGSITATTEFGTGTIVSDTDGKPGKFSEDAWGQRRNPFTWSGAPVTDSASANKSDDGGFDSLTPRGYTGHEMLDDLGLVHMNGRIYDPLLGRFLSADTVVQAPGDLQVYNRYSYVKNNPLTLTDPSGFSFLLGSYYAAPQQVHLKASEAQRRQIELSNQKLNEKLTVGHAAIAGSALIAVAAPEIVGTAGFVKGAVTGGAVGATVGGATSAIQSGGDPKATAAGALGGLVSGVITGGPAGIITNTIATSGLTAAVTMESALGSAVAGAAAGAAGSVTTQTAQNVMNGDNLSTAIARIDGAAVASSTAVGMITNTAMGGVAAVVEGSATRAIAQGEANAVTHAANVAVTAITPAAENSLVAQTATAIAGQSVRAESTVATVAMTAAVVSQAVENTTNQVVQDQKEEDERKRKQR